MPRPVRSTVAVLLALAAGAVLAAPVLLYGHAVVFPRESAPGAYEKYVLRVPNEKGVATVKVELRFPTEVRVVSFADVAGWALQVQSDSAKRIVGATWTGTLPPERFIEFPFVAVNPNAEARLVWPAYQTYADGERVEWTGPEDSKTPASATVMRSAAPTGTRSNAALWVAVAGLVLALLSLGLTLRRPLGP